MKKTTLFLVFFMIYPVSAQWNDCPFGLVNDPYPGKCPRYVDTDGDGICDRSQPSPENRVGVEDNQKSNPELLEGNQPVLISRYNAIPISIIMIILFFLTGLAVKKNFISTIAAKYFWNVILAITFFITLIASLPSIFPGLKTGLNHLWLHVEAGIIMAWITLYHLWERRYFYTRCFPKKTQNKCK
jgi:hypothetical protein